MNFSQYSKPTIKYEASSGSLRDIYLKLQLMTPTYTKLSPTEILQLRKSLGWTQTVMGQYLKVTDRTVAYWEKGQVVPNEYQMAALQIMQDRLQQSKQNSAKFKEGLNQQLPAILFGVGIAALFVYLLNSKDE